MKWINVKDETPPCCLNLLVLIDGKVGVLMQTNGKWYFSNRKCYGETGRGVLIKEAPDLWMRLPKVINEMD